MTDWKVEVEVEVNTDKFNDSIRDSMDKTVGDVNRALSDSVSDIDTSGMVDKIRNAMSGIKGEHIEVFLDTVQAEAQFMSMKDLAKMSAGDIQDSFKNVSLGGVQSAIGVLTDSIAINRDKVEELKASMSGLNNADTFVAEQRIKALEQASMDAESKVKILSDQLKSLGGAPTSASLDNVMTKIRATGDEAEKASSRTAKSSSLSLSSFKRMAFGLIGVQSMYALVSKSMRDYISAHPELQSQISGITSALGSLLAPALGFIISAFQTLVRWIMIAIAYITTFINVIFGTNIAVRLTLDAVTKTNNGLSKMGKSAKKAGSAIKKAMKGAIANFDDLNVITSDTDDNLAGMGGDMGGVGGMDVAPPDMSAFDISEYINPLKKFGEWLEKNKGWVKVLTVAFLAFIATILIFKGIMAVVTGVMAFFGIVANASLAIPILIISAIIVALALLWIYWDDIVAFMKVAWEALWAGIQAVASFVMDILKLAWDGLLVALEFAIWIFVSAWELAWNIITTVVDIVVQAIVALWTGFVALLGFVLDGFVAVWDFIWEGIKLAFTVILDLLATLWTGLWDGIKLVFEIAVAVIKAGLDALGAFFKFIWDGVLAVFEIVAGVIGTVWNTTVDGIKSIFKGVWDFLTGAVNNIGKVFSNVWTGIKDSFSNAFNGIKTIFTNVWDWILGQFSKGGSIFSGVVDGVAGVFTTIVNTLISGINRIISIPFDVVNGTLNGIRNIGIMGVKPFSGLWSHNPIPVPQVPRLKDGGFAQARRGGTHVLVGEGIYDEAITPTGGPRFREMTSNIAKDVVEFTGGGTGGGDTNVDLYIQFEDSTFGRASIKAINSVQRSAGKVLVKI